MEDQRIHGLNANRDVGLDYIVAAQPRGESPRQVLIYEFLDASKVRILGVIDDAPISSDDPVLLLLSMGAREKPPDP